MKSLEIIGNAARYTLALDVLDKGEKRTKQIKARSAEEGRSPLDIRTQNLVFANRIRTLGEHQIIIASRITGVDASVRAIRKIVR